MSVCSKCNCYPLLRFQVRVLLSCTSWMIVEVYLKHGSSRACRCWNCCICLSGPILLIFLRKNGTEKLQSNINKSQMCSTMACNNSNFQVSWVSTGFFSLPWELLILYWWWTAWRPELHKSASVLHPVQ